MNDHDVIENDALKQQLLAEGHAHFDASDYTRALDSYHRASLLDTADPRVWIALGLTFSNLQFSREAWRSYLLALSLERENSDALWHAAEFLFEIEDLALADLLLGRYLEIEQDAERLIEARTLRTELRAEAQARGVSLAQERGAEASALLADDQASGVQEQLDAQPEAPEEIEEVEEVEQDLELSDEELEAQALSAGEFVAPLALRLSGFEATCQHCNLRIPADAPYCWSCRIIHFYD